MPTSELAFAYMILRSFKATSHAMNIGALDGYSKDAESSYGWVTGTKAD